MSHFDTHCTMEYTQGKLKELYSSSHLNRLLSQQINSIPITHLFPKYHMSKHYITFTESV